MLERRLKQYIDTLEMDIERLQRNDSDEIRNLLNEADARLIADIREDLIELLEV